jgi:hypothetical protein
MKTALQSLCRCVKATDWRARLSIAACAACLLSLVVFLPLSGCASTPAGLDREQALYQAGTNVVTTIHEIVPYLPAPAGTAVEGMLALATAALAAWNTHQHLQIRTLKNGNGNGTTVKSPTTGPPPTAHP